MRKLLPSRHEAWESCHIVTALRSVCDAMIHATSMFKGLCTHYLELWLTLRDAARKPSVTAKGWPRWLELCEEALRRPFSLHTITMGHRLLTHTQRVLSHSQNMSASQEQRDPFTAVMRRVWPSNYHATKLRNSLQKLCRDNNNAASREAICADLRRVVLAYRMGWITDHRTTKTCGEHQHAFNGFREAAAHLWNPVDEPDCVDALQAYLAWYVQNCGVLRAFAREHLPSWAATAAIYLRVPGSPASAAPSSSGLWLPEHSFGFLVRHAMSESVLRQRLMQPVATEDEEEKPSDSYTEHLRWDAIAALDARQALTLQQTDGASPCVLDCATWQLLGEQLLLSDATVAFFTNLTRAHYRHENVKTRFKEWVRQQTQQAKTTFRDLAALRVLFQLLRERQAVYTTRVPYLWAHTTACAFEDRETAAGVSMSPMCDVFMYCPTCMRVCSFCAPQMGSPFDPPPGRGRHTRRRRRKASRARVSSQTTVAGEPIFSAGFRFVISDVDTDRYMCASRKTGSMRDRCRDSELRQIHLTGKLLVFHGRVFLLCPQPRCARIMEFEPGVCRFNQYGPCCSVCSSLQNAVLPPMPPTPAQRAADREFAQRLDEKLDRLVARQHQRLARVISFDEDDNE